jgi:hypothetical protein
MPAHRNFAANQAEAYYARFDFVFVTGIIIGRMHNDWS